MLKARRIESRGNYRFRKFRAFKECRIADKAASYSRDCTFHKVDDNSNATHQKFQQSFAVVQSIAGGYISKTNRDRSRQDVYPRERLSVLLRSEQRRFCLEFYSS